MKAIEDINLDSVCRKHVSGNLCKILTVIAAVERYADRQVAFAVGFHVVGKTLGCHADCIFVHTVGSYTHNSAKTACTEFKIAVECVFQGYGIVSHKFLYLVFCLLVEIAVQPALGYLSEIFFHMF